MIFPKYLMECGIKVYFPNSKIKVYHVIFWSGLKEIYLTEKKVYNVPTFAVFRQNNPCWCTPRFSSWLFTLFDICEWCFRENVINVQTFCWWEFLIQYSSYNFAEMECCINKDLNTLDMWSKKKLLQFNPNKTKATYLNHFSNSVI